MRIERIDVKRQNNEQEVVDLALLNPLIEKYRNKTGNLIPLLQGTQDIYGYIPLEVQEMIAKGLKVSVAQVFGVITFYSQFSTTPKGENKISVCLGTACYVKGADKIFDKIGAVLNIKDGEVTEDGRFSLDAQRCIGACGLAPVIIINDEVYGNLSIEAVEGILKQYM